MHTKAPSDMPARNALLCQLIHLVRCGSRDALLGQLTADACGLPVIAGPVEASALGNVLVQAWAVGALAGGLAEMRRLVRGSVALIRYQPAGDRRQWDAAAWPLVGTPGTALEGEAPA